MGKTTFRTGGIALLVILGLVSGVFYGKNIATPPGGHHAWAMADYYAMAIKFADNHLNIFRPQTFSLTTKEGVTASDFPLPAWCSAVLMKISGADSPVIFRLLTLCFGFSGFFFFYRSLFEQGLSAVNAALLTLFLWFLPGFVYYHDGFMPSVWALSTFLIGLWALQRDLQGRRGYWALAIGAFVLAALLRKPYVLQLLALGAWHIFFRKDWRKTLIGLVGLSVFALWQVYDWHLYQTYGSIFLRNLMPPRSAGEAWLLIMGVWRKWGVIWLSPAHIAWFVLAIALTLKQTGAHKANSITWYFGGVLLSGALYFVLMLRQFSDHEYYAIDCFYPVVFVGLLISAKSLQERPWHSKVLLGLTILAGLWAYKTLHWYNTLAPQATADKTAKVYENSRPLMESLSVGQNARMLVFEGYSTNLPLIGMGRPGYCLLSSNEENQEKMLDMQPDYAVCLDTNFISEVVNDNPAVVNKLEFVGRSSDLWVFRPGKHPENTLENLLASEWTTVVDTSIGSTDEYLFSKRVSSTSGDKVIFHGLAGIKAGGELVATVALFQSGVPVKVLERKIFFEPSETQRYISTDLNIPSLSADEARVYLWNPKKKQAIVENFRISLLKLKPLAR